LDILGIIDFFLQIMRLDEADFSMEKLRRGDHLGNSHSKKYKRRSKE
jgi:hypothetical protein